MTTCPPMERPGAGPVGRGRTIPDGAVRLATAQKFKGCERPYSIVIWTQAMTPARFYTACTRARLGLAVVNVAG